MNNIEVVSHVGRDIVQSAQLFKTPEAAVWEYVVNSLQYVDSNVVAQVEVNVDVQAKKITIDDNGAGMDLLDLKHFFTMHGENLERRRGVPGRGKFGTGKSAAFGIGTSLVVSSTKNGKRQTVELTRAAIDASDGTSVPVTFVEQDIESKESNGTKIVISGISVRLSREPVVALIERHLSAFQGSPVVSVNGRACEIVRPNAALTRTFTPTKAQAEIIGDIELEVSAASAPLDPIHRGVQITVGPDNLIAVESAGVDGKEQGQFLFGQVDCLELDNAKYEPQSAYDASRSMQLNKAHPVALALTTFIGASLEVVRQELVAESRKAKADADARRLKETTSRIEELLNEDLRKFREQIEGLGGNDRRRKSPFGGGATGPEEAPATVVIDPNGTENGRADGDGDEGPGTPPPAPGPDPEPWVPPGPDPDGAKGAVSDPEGEEKVGPAGQGEKQRLRGGLQIDTAHYGADEDRSFWEKDARKITINLDHPVVKAAKSLPDDEASYRRLIWEIAFTTYAVALADLQFERDPALDSSDATYAIREALRRVWANAGALYAV